MARPSTIVAAPAVTPLPFGLLSAADVDDDLTGHAQMGVQYQVPSCGVVHATRAACEDEAAEFTEREDGVPWAYGEPFTLYSFFVCRPVGMTTEELETRAADSLRLGESRGVERALAARLPLHAGAVDVTPAAGAVSPSVGVGLLEEYAGQHYGGRPTLHLPRAVTPLIDHVQRDGANLVTRQGSAVAAGAGYWDLDGPAVNAPPEDDPQGTPVPTPQAAPPGTRWVYVTGQPVVRRAPSAEGIPLLMGRVPATNDAVVLAMRPYVVTWDCVTAAVLVRVHEDPV